MGEVAEPKAAPDRFGMDAVNAAVQALAVLGAGAWGMCTFVHEAEIVPGSATPTVSAASALEKAGGRGDLVAIRSTVTRTDVGQTGVRLLGFTHNVVGVRVHFGEGLFGADAALGRSSAVSAAKRHNEAESGAVVPRDGVLFEGPRRSRAAGRA